LSTGPAQVLEKSGRSVLNLIPLIVFSSAMVFAAVWDLTTMTIPNCLTLALAAGFVLVLPFSGLGLAQIGLHIAAGAVMLLVGMACFGFGWIGGGDAKLVAATALWIGWSDLLVYLLMASVFGGALTLLILYFRSLPLPLALGRQAWVARLHDQKAGIPYGLALAAGALFILPQTGWFKLASSLA